MPAHSLSRDGRRESGSEHPPKITSAPTRSDFLTIKTPLLPRRSGINMESARSYGADMEKHDFITNSDATQNSSPPPRRSRSTFNWIAGLALFGVFSIGIYNNVPAYEATKNVVTGSRPVWRNAQSFDNEGGELWSRQKSTDIGDGSNSTRALIPFTYAPIPLGSIKPMGWMLDNMQGMADGLAGHEHDFYPPVSSSPWFGIGEQDYAPLNEGVPYWFNALVPLAYGLGDSRLIGQVQDALSQILSRQNYTDGWLGPINPQSHDKTSQDLWARFPIMLGMTQMMEADPSLAPQILNAMYRFIPTLYSKLHDGLYPNEVWGRARYADAVISMQWLYENYPVFNGTDYRGLLSNTMYRLKDHGADWVGYFQPQSFFFQDIDTIVPSIEDDGGTYFPFLHGVNAGQGLKTPAVDYRFTHNTSLLDVQRNAIDWSLQYHGNAMGSLVGDERENGVNPNRGSELCTAVETMYSMTYSYAVTGVNAFADNAERIAFNALPGMMTADNWAHQYIALSNQPWASPLDGGAIFWNVGDYGATFGLAPNYPCCTVNHPQGYAKFLSHSWMTSGDDGLAHVFLSPSNITTKLGNGANVNIAAVTDYPFSDILTYNINTDKAFTFYVRVPNWSAAPSFMSNGVADSVSVNSDTGLAQIAVPAGQTSVQYVLSSSLQAVPRANDTVAIYNGALLYALDVGYEQTTSNANAAVTRNKPPTNNPAIQVALQYNANEAGPSSTPAQARDYNISNTMAWNYAIDPASLKYFVSNTSSDPGAAVNQSRVNAYAGESTDSSSPPSLPNPIWSYQAPEQYVKGVACLINWPLKGNAPFIPPSTSQRNCTTGKSVEVVFRPYGSLKVHMAELPTKALGAPSLNGTASR